MPESVALAGPKELRPFVEELENVGDVDPIAVLFAKDETAGARGSDGVQQVEAVLDAIQALDEEAAAIRDPAHPREQRIAGFAEVHPPGVAAGGGDHAQADIGVGIAGLGIALRFIDGAQRQEVGVRIERLAAHVELQIGDLLGIGRPPVRGGEVELLGIDPIEAGVPQGGGAIAGQPGH